MKVKVIKQGFDGLKRRYPGEVFDFEGPLGSWMVPVEEDEPKRKRRTKAEIEADKEAEALSSEEVEPVRSMEEGAD